MTKTNRRKVASYIGARIVDPVGWTSAAPGTAAPGGTVYVTDGATPPRYQISAPGVYVTRPV